MREELDREGEHGVSVGASITFDHHQNSTERITDRIRESDSWLQRLATVFTSMRMIRHVVQVRTSALRTQPITVCIDSHPALSDRQSPRDDVRAKSDKF